MPKRKSNLHNASTKAARRQRIARDNRSKYNNCCQARLTDEIMPKRKIFLEANSERKRRRRRQAIGEMAAQKQQFIEQFSQDVANLDSTATKSRETLYLSNEKQQFFDFTKNVTDVVSVPMIKTEILDPFEQNQEFILPDFPQHVTTRDPIIVGVTEIQDSSKTSNILLPNIKVEPAEIDNALRTEEFSENFINTEIENSLIFQCKFSKCFVLLRDCLIPENLASISAKFKSLRINTSISERIPEVELFPLSDAPFFAHISESYKKMEFLGTCWKMASSRKEKKMTRKREVHSNIIKKKSRSQKYACNCFKDPEHAMSTMGSQLYENNFDSTQQLCSCRASDKILSESIDIIMQETSLFDPDFGKISCGLNQINYNF